MEDDSLKTFIKWIQSPSVPSVQNGSFNTEGFDFIKIYLLGILNYIPLALVMFGVIADSISQKFQYSIVSIIGILSVIINWVIGVILSVLVGLDVDQYASRIKCVIPGFSFLDSMFSSQIVVFLSSIITYLFIDLGTHRTPSENLGLHISFLGLGIVHIVLMYFNNCFDAYVLKQVSVLTGLLLGALFGVVSWFVVSKISPQSLPSANIPSNSTPTSHSKIYGPGGTLNMVSEGEQDQFVCDLYKNGELITSTISS